MGEYNILIIDSIIRDFSIVGIGQEFEFTYSSKGEESLFQKLQNGSKILGYISNTKNEFCYIFEVKQVGSDKCILIKEYESIDGLKLNDVEDKIKSNILDNQLKDSLLSIDKEEYNNILNGMFNVLKNKHIGNVNVRSININYKTGLESEFEKNRIIFGSPGTGKSSKLKSDCNCLMKDTSGTYERVTFHPDYTYSHFVGTYKPISDGAEIRYEFVPGPFLRIYVDALRSGISGNPQPHLLLIEEINRAKVAAVFGDIFQLLDRDEDGTSEYEINTSEDIRNYLEKELGVSKDGYKKIKIPDNMFIWATMNSADQGVFPMDTAFKRRWEFEYIGINENDSDIKGKISLGEDKYKLEVEWNTFRKAINYILSEKYKVNEDKLIGPYFLSKKVMAIVSDTDTNIAQPDKFKEAFKNKIIMYLYEDAVKQSRHKLFEACKSEDLSTATYSSICEAFDKMGIYIFGNNFKELYDKQGV